MGLMRGGQVPARIYRGNTPVSRVYRGNTLAWAAVPTVTLTTAGGALGPYNQFRAALADYGVNYETMTELPFQLDVSNTFNLSYLFFGCSALAAIPDLHVAHVTNAANMFNGCSSLTDGNVRLIGKHPSVNTDFMINNSGLTREPFYDAAGNPI